MTSIVPKLFVALMENAMSWACSRHGEVLNAYTVLVGDRGLQWTESNIKIDLKSDAWVWTEYT